MPAKSTAESDVDERFEQLLNRLVDMSKRDYYNPYQIFQWPDDLPQEQFWMSPELMSVHGTEVAGELSEDQLWRISKWESVNFYSLNVHGIKELLIEIISRIHTAGFSAQSEYFHHVIGEENEHMWFFATFCLKYGDKIYPNKQLKLNNSQSPAIANLLVFAKLLILEEVVDFFNKRMGVDERLHPTIRQVNAIHHQDESRHIAFGRRIVAALFEKIKDDLTDEEHNEVETYLRRYIDSSLDSFCNPAIFADAGIEDPYGVRRRVFADPAYQALRTRITKGIVGFLETTGVFSKQGEPKHA